MNYVGVAHAWFYVYSSKSSSKDLATDVNIGPILECYDNPTEKIMGKAMCFKTEKQARREAQKMADHWQQNLYKTHMTTTDIENWKKK